MKHARFATIHLFALLLLALTGGGHTAHATQVCRNIISNDFDQTVCRQPNGEWMLVNVPAPEEDAAHEFFDQYGQDFVGLDLSYQAAVKCGTRSQAWGDAAEHAISDELNRSISQNVGPLDSPNS